MPTPYPQNSTPDRRTSKRVSAENHYSVQFFVEGLGSEYQFKLQDVSPGGLSILVSQNSPVLDHLNVDDILEMAYYSEEAKHGYQRIRTRIRHITPSTTGRYAGHCIVGLRQLDNMLPD